mmetsp:Transcript_25183/g.70183  ORF Transcript_25183/g.70183 Transcript_25183/m.70183 type:complete len:289 (+) Transcript_25183:1077-1943(+)
MARRRACSARLSRSVGRRRQQGAAVEAALPEVSQECLGVGAGEAQPQVVAPQRGKRPVGVREELRALEAADELFPAAPRFERPLLRDVSPVFFCGFSRRHTVVQRANEVVETQLAGGWFRRGLSLRGKLGFDPTQGRERTPGSHQRRRGRPLRRREPRQRLLCSCLYHALPLLQPVLLSNDLGVLPFLDAAALWVGEPTIPARAPPPEPTRGVLPDGAHLLGDAGSAPAALWSLTTAARRCRQCAPVPLAIGIVHPSRGRRGPTLAERPRARKWSPARERRRGRRRRT